MLKKYSGCCTSQRVSVNYTSVLPYMSEEIGKFLCCLLITDLSLCSGRGKPVTAASTKPEIRFAVSFIVHIQKKPPKHSEECEWKIYFDFT